MKAAYSIKIKVPFGDVDMMGHVNNAKYLTYFETARTEYLSSQFGPILQNPKESVIIARAEVNYRSPAKWNDELIVKVRPSSVGNSSWVYDYEIVRAARDEEEGIIVADGKTVQVSYDYTRRTKIPIPEELRRSLLKDIERTTRTTMIEKKD
jgi:acyl-CoA thioester hydrolase